jgi:aryl-alcohol dehydrogenase-like predicted oxidoreductase
MRYNRYVKGSPDVSEIGLGAWQLGSTSYGKSITSEEAIELVHKALDRGVNFFDTAPNYGKGTSELRLGKALRGKDRSKIVINTKFGHTDTGELNFEASNIRKSLEGSLKRLQTDYVDSLIIHNPPIEYLNGNNNPHYKLLEKLIEEGKIKAYGASLDTYKEMKIFMNTTNGKVIEAFFNILFQDTARAFETVKEKDIKIIAKIPLDSGWLTGKYGKRSSFKDIRVRWSDEDIETRAELVEKVKRIIPDAKKISQTAISFCLAYDAVTTVIPGSKNIAQLFRNLQSIDNPVSKDLVKKLEDFYKNEVVHLKLPW